MKKYSKTPWGFDGHGINDADGERIAKVMHGEPYVHPDGLPIRNERFDADSVLIEQAPAMLSVLEDVAEFIEEEFTREIRSAIPGWYSILKAANKVINEATRDV